MVSTRKKKQSDGRFYSQLDDIDQDVNISSALGSGQQNVVVYESTVVQEVTIDITGSNLAANDNPVNIQILERRFNERIVEQMGNIVDTVKDRIQSPIPTTIDDTNTPRIELAVRSKNAPCGRDATSVTANWEYEERVGITASFENVSEKNSTLHVMNNEWLNA